MNEFQNTKYILCAQSYARLEITKMSWMGCLPEIKLRIAEKTEGETYLDHWTYINREFVLNNMSA